MSIPPSTSTGQSVATDENERLRIIREEIMAFLHRENDLGLKTDDIGLKTAPVQAKLHTIPAEEAIVEKKRSKKEKKKGKEKTRKKTLKQNLCKNNEIIDGRFRIAAKIKQGGFGQIYKAIDSKYKTEVALKVEPLTEYSDNVESHVLGKLQNKPHYPIIYASGISSNYTYIALQLLGENLSDLRKMCRMKIQRLSVGTSFRVAVQCLEALEVLHNSGYLHRDVKPSNFAIGSRSKDRNVVYILDFGLCRYFLCPDGSVKPPRPKIGFRGTVRYASTTAHELKDLSRRDDMWSLFYSFYELMIGHLHWKNTNEKDEVMKQKMAHTPESMCRGLPKEVKEFVRLIRSLRYEDKPSYQDMYTVLNDFLKQINITPTDYYDWQVKDCRSMYHWLLLKS